MLKHIYSPQLDVANDGFYTVNDSDGTWIVYPGGHTLRPGVMGFENPKDLIPQNSPVINSVDADTAAMRHNACKACNKYSASSDRCGTCGCSSTMTEATASPWRKCPENRWPITSTDKITH
jgi:hypothetical protein